MCTDPRCIALRFVVFSLIVPCMGCQKSADDLLLLLAEEVPARAIERGNTRQDIEHGRLYTLRRQARGFTERDLVKAGRRLFQQTSDPVQRARIVAAVNLCLPLGERTRPEVFEACKPFAIEAISDASDLVALQGIEILASAATPPTGESAKIIARLDSADSLYLMLRGYEVLESWGVAEGILRGLQRPIPKREDKERYKIWHVTTSLLIAMSNREEWRESRVPQGLPDRLLEIGTMEPRLMDQAIIALVCLRAEGALQRIRGLACQQGKAVDRIAPCLAVLILDASDEEMRGLLPRLYGEVLAEHATAAVDDPDWDRANGLLSLCLLKTRERDLVSKCWRAYLTLPVAGQSYQWQNIASVLAKDEEMSLWWLAATTDEQLTSYAKADPGFAYLLGTLYGDDINTCVFRQKNPGRQEAEKRVRRLLAILGKPNGI